MGNKKYQQQIGDTTMLIELEFMGVKTIEEVFEELIIDMLYREYREKSA